MMKGILPDIRCDRFSNEGWVRSSTPVPDEMELTIYVNRQELVTIQCTPNKLNCLALGFLYTQGIISSLGDVATMRVCDDESEVHVTLNDPEFELPTRRTLTSGCGGGVAFRTRGEKVESNLTLTPKEVLSLMKQFLKRGEGLLRGLSAKNGLLLGTGRISSEMLLKAASMQVPILVSLTSPTGRAILLARDLGIAIVGYARGRRLSVYSHPERLGRSA
jgi:FdhD protein